MSKWVIDMSAVTVTIRPVNTEEFVTKAIAALDRQIPKEVDDFTEGVAQGIRWAIRYLSGDKSAS